MALQFRQWIKGHRIVGWLFFASLIVHLLASIFLYHKFGENVLYFENEDAYSYVNLAKSIVAGDGFAYDQSPSGARTPLYPLFLAFVFWLPLPFTWAVLLIQGVSASLTAAVVYLIGKEHFSRRVGLIAGIATAIEPYMLMTANLGTTETIFTTLLVSALFFFLRWYSTPGSSVRLLLTAAVLFGLSAITRPVALYFPIVCGFLIIIRSLRMKERLLPLLRSLAIFFIVFGAVLTPWMVRQYLVFGVPRLSTIDAAMLYFKTAPLVIAHEQGIGYDAATRELSQRLGLESNAFESSRAMNTFDYYDRMKKDASEIIVREPLVVGRFYALSLIPALFGTGYEYMMEGIGGVVRETPREGYTSLILRDGWRGVGTIVGRLDIFQIVLFGSMALWAAVYLVIVGAVLRPSFWRSHHSILLVLLVTIAYFVLLMLGPAAHARYRMPTFPLWFLLFAGSLQWLRTRARSSQ